MGDNRERPTPPWFNAPPKDWAKDLAPSPEWMRPPDVPTILKPHQASAPHSQPHSKPRPAPPPARPPRKPEAPSNAQPAAKPVPIQIEGEPGSILLSCLGCDTPIRQLVIRQVARAVIQGAPILPRRCQHCGVRYSDESLDRLRRFIYEHARSGHRGDVRFALYPAEWMR